MRGVYIALGNREQTGQPGFGGQQVIKGVVQLLLTHPVADMKQAPAGAVQKPVVRRQRQGLHAPGQHLKLGALCITRHRHTVAPLCTKIKTRLGGGEQVATQVAAVDGGHIGGQQHCQGLGVVPVQKMPLVPGQLVQRIQRCFQAGSQIGHADPARLCCAGAAQKVQADIGRRGAVRQHFKRQDLQVVGRQAMVLCRHTALKKAPGVLRHALQVGHSGGVRHVDAAAPLALAGQPQGQR